MKSIVRSNPLSAVMVLSVPLVALLALSSQGSATTVSEDLVARLASLDPTVVESPAIEPAEALTNEELLDWTYTKKKVKPFKTPKSTKPGKTFTVTCDGQVVGTGLTYIQAKRLEYEQEKVAKSCKVKEEKQKKKK